VTLRTNCLQNPHTKYRQVYKFEGRHRPPAVENATTGMIQKIDSPLGRFIYSRRMGIIEPVFGDVRHALGLDRFTLKGNKTRSIFSGRSYTMVHNLYKVLRYGWRADRMPTWTVGDGGIEKTLSTLCTRKDGNQMERRALEILLNVS
jgi:hypothetical protein